VSYATHSSQGSGAWVARGWRGGITYLYDGLYQLHFDGTIIGLGQLVKDHHRNVLRLGILDCDGMLGCLEYEIPT